MELILVQMILVMRNIRLKVRDHHVYNMTVLKKYFALNFVLLILNYAKIAGNRLRKETQILRII